MNAFNKFNFQHSMVPAIELQTAADNMLTYLKTNMALSIESGIVVPDSGPQETQYLRYPVVVIINGAGGNGKDTFINLVSKCCAVLNISAIDEIRTVAQMLIDNTIASGGATFDVAAAAENKEDIYRAFLHELKMAWVDFCDGPALSLYADIRAAVSRQLSGEEHVDIIFLHMREASEISKVCQYVVTKIGLVCLTVLMKGRTKASDFENEADANVEEYPYDLTIYNSSSLEVLNLQASMFASRLCEANQRFGISIPNLAATPAPELTPTTPNTSANTTGENSAGENKTATADGKLGFRSDDAYTGTTRPI